MNDLQALLEKAAGWLDEHEWCQGATFDRASADDDPHAACLLGSIWIGAGEQWTLHEWCVEIVAATITSLYGSWDRWRTPMRPGEILSPRAIVASWNDTSGRTYDEVRAVLAAAIAATA